MTKIEKATYRSEGHEVFIAAKVRRHRFIGIDPRHCDDCGREFSSVTHK